jgi:hypothetical protein
VSVWHPDSSAIACPFALHAVQIKVNIKVLRLRHTTILRKHIYKITVVVGLKFSVFLYTQIYRTLLICVIWSIEVGCDKSYIHILREYLSVDSEPLVCQGVFIETSHSHSFRSTTLGRTPMDKCSAHRRNLYQTKRNNHNRQTSMLWRDSNPKSHQARGRRPPPYTARPPASAMYVMYIRKFVNCSERFGGFFFF